jgi:glutaconate CoA-transferase subunit B
MRHTPRTFVEKLDFITSLGHGPTGRERRAMNLSTEGPSLIVTDLCLMRPDPESMEFVVVSVHPGVTADRIRESTGWPVRFAGDVTGTRPPDPGELSVLRDLTARTAMAHGIAAGE